MYHKNVATLKLPIYEKMAFFGQKSAKNIRWLTSE